MGLIRGGLLTFGCILLFLSLFAMNTFWTISMSLDYDVIKPELVSVVGEIIRNQTSVASDMDNAIGGMLIICLNNTEVVQEFGGEVYTFPCETVNQGSEAIITYAISSLVEKKYYQEYNCSFWECSYTPPYHFVSAKAQSYWNGWFYTSLILSLIFAAMLFFLVENKHNFPFVIGGLVIISVLPFAKVSWLLSLLGHWEFLQFFALFFSKSYNVFVTMLIIGIVSLGIGVVLKFLGIGEFITGLFGKNKSGKVSVDEEEEDSEEDEEAEERKTKKKGK